MNVYQTGDDTYTGFAFTPNIPGVDQVEVVASLDPVTGEESPSNIEAARRFAALLADQYEDRS